MISEKYGRTYHYPFSPGTTSDDRINHTYWEDIQRIRTLVHTEKLDGENNCLSQWVFLPVRMLLLLLHLGRGNCVSVGN